MSAAEAVALARDLLARLDDGDAIWTRGDVHALCEAVVAADPLKPETASYGRRAVQIGDALVEFIQKHEELAHGGERCETETCNMIGYLCHRVGLNFNAETVGSEAALEQLRTLVERNRDYSAVHAEHHDVRGYPDTPPA